MKTRNVGTESHLIKKLVDSACRNAGGVFYYLCKRPQTDNMTFDINKTEYIAILAGIDCLPPVKEGEVIAPAFVELAQKTAIEHFTHRFPDLFQENQDKYKLFLENSSIQKQLSEWKLDRIKFWYLHLFIIDYVTDSFSDVTIFEELSTKQYIEKLIKSLEKTDIENFCLDIRINKEKLSTRNPWVGVALLSALKQDFPFDWVNNNTFVSKDIKEDIERYTTARMKFSTELYSHFFDQYLHKSQRGRKSFIGKFLYLADLTRDERYWYGCKPTLAKFCKKYEIAQYQKIMVDGVEHIAIPFDVGKDLSDHIKKCTMIPQVRHSFYFSPVDE